MLTNDLFNLLFSMIFCQTLLFESSKLFKASDLSSSQIYRTLFKMHSRFRAISIPIFAIIHRISSWFVIQANRRLPHLVRLQIKPQVHELFCHRPSVVSLNGFPLLKAKKGFTHCAMVDY